MTPHTGIAIIGMACRFPDATGPEQLWENVLACRRAFRTIPPERLAAGYFSDSTDTVAGKDKIAAKKAALLANYQFDRRRFNISAANFRTADLCHWLALEVAADAIRQSSIENLPKLHKQETGVIVGNTLTGEFVRSNILRLRWPYVQKTARDAMSKSGIEEDVIRHTLEEMESIYKSAFPVMEEDSLAGGLSNTIAGRICNYYDFKGGGYTVDGACSSSLLAICKACDSISSGQLTIAIVGGVDISLDPFELVGFSRAGALATGEMQVYDKRSGGFWPGEGCGFAVMTSQDLAQEYGLPILAVIKGWGLSSDGKGGLTRPEADGQCLALKRAYAKAGYGLDSVAYIEGHGTGTHMGDEVELRALLKMLPVGDACKTTYLGSIKANIGHTKAAAGMAGLIKAVMAIRSGVIPPITGNTNPHQLLETAHRLSLPRRPLRWNSPEPLRVGVSAMGFGGINTHITLQGPPNAQQTQLTPGESTAASTPQDTELFLLSAESRENLEEELNKLLASAKHLSLAELTDLSHTLYCRLHVSAYRLAIEAPTPELLSQRVERTLRLLDENCQSLVDIPNGIFFSKKIAGEKIGFLFPGQGTGLLQREGLLFRRWPFLKAMLPHNPVPGNDNPLDTLEAQLKAIGTAIMGVRLLQQMQVTPDVLVGHSVGELAALHTAGFADETTIMQLASARGTLMQNTPEIQGGMLSIPVDAETPLTKQLLEEENISLAAINGPNRIVLSGKKNALLHVQQRYRDQHIPSVFLQVENAFHSSLLSILEQPWKNILDKVWPSNPPPGNGKEVYSTVTGEKITHPDSICDYLVRQLTSPVLFLPAFQKANEIVDCWIEVGKGTTLQKLALDITQKPVVSLDLSGDTVKGVLHTAGLLFAHGYPVSLETVFSGRFFRDFALGDTPEFITNPCESNPATTRNDLEILPARDTREDPIRTHFKTMLAEKLELSAETICDSFRMLDDLHLNSLYVVELLSEFSEKFQLPLTVIPMEYANATVEEIVQMFYQIKEKPHGGIAAEKPDPIHGIGAWVYPFRILHREVPLPQGSSSAKDTGRWVFINNRPAINAARAGLPKPQGTGIFVQLYTGDEPRTLDALARLTDLIRMHKDLTTIVLIQQSMMATAFCKSLFLESGKIKMLIITDEDLLPDTGFLSRELAALRQFTEVFYKKSKREQSFLTPIHDLPQPISPSIPGESRFLVTGGAKGITFECARLLGRKYRCKLILLGRSDPAGDPETGRNIRQLQQENIRAAYYRCDISDEEKCHSVLADIQKEHGAIDGILHGSGINTPNPMHHLTREKIVKTLAPKVYGLRNLLANIDCNKLRYCFTFGSFLAETGMEGNADYTLANEWLSEAVRRMKTEHPEIYFLNIEWSVWAGTGMGQQLGVLERLMKRGITPISLDDGLAFFARLLERRVEEPNIIVTGRFPALPTCHSESPVLPPLRYMEQIRLFYPGIELIADFTLSTTKDPYLTGHVVNGRPIFPGVCGLEAMVQAIRHLLGNEFPDRYCLKDVEFLHPIIIKENEEKKCRVIVQRKDQNSFVAVVREEDSSYLVDHFRLLLTLQDPAPVHMPEIPSPFSDPLIDVETQVYGPLLFHGKPFQTIHAYRHLTPYACIADCDIPAKCDLYSDFMPQETVMMHPLLHDSLLQAVQACVPHQTMLPVGIGAWNIREKTSAHAQSVTVHAYEVNRVEDLYVYDIFVSGEQGVLLEELRSASFRSVKGARPHALALPLIKITLLRKVHELSGERNGLSLEFNDKIDNHDIYHRADGRPLRLDNSGISRSYLEEGNMTVQSRGNIACDIEKVTQCGSLQWQNMLGGEKFRLARVVQEKANEDLSAACTRVWSATECIRKAGASLFSPLSLSTAGQDGCLCFSSGSHKIVSFQCFVPEFESTVVFTVLTTQE